MDKWSIDDVELWLVYTRQHDPAHLTKVSPILGLDGKELLSFFDDEGDKNIHAYFSACAEYRLLMLQKKVSSDRGKVARFWERSGGNSVRNLSWSYDSPISLCSPPRPSASLSSTPSSTDAESEPCLQVPTKEADVEADTADAGADGDDSLGLDDMDDAATSIKAKVLEALLVHNSVYSAGEVLSVEGEDVTCTACRVTIKWNDKVGFAAITNHYKTTGHKSKVEYDPSRQHTKKDLSTVLLTTGYDSLSKAWTVLPEGKDGMLQMQCCLSTGCNVVAKGKSVHAILRFAKQHVCKTLKRKTSTGLPPLGESTQRRKIHLSSPPANFFGANSSSSSSSSSSNSSNGSTSVVSSPSSSSSNSSEGGSSSSSSSTGCFGANSSCSSSGTRSGGRGGSISGSSSSGSSSEGGTSSSSSSTTSTEGHDAGTLRNGHDQ